MEIKVRLKEANREQMTMEVIDYEELLPLDHTARILVKFVEQLELDSFYAEIKSVLGTAGRPAIDPKLLLCLWLYASIEGIGSARLLEKLCERDNAYRWICGGVRVNYHTLSDFRCVQGEKLDQLLTDIMSTFISKGIVRLKSIIVDGTKIKANASKKSFKKREKLNQLKEQTLEYVKGLREELEQDCGASQRRREMARETARKKMEAKVKAALKELPKVEAVKESRKKKVKKGTKVSEAKASVSDPDSRMMKFSDKSVKAGYNCQIAIEPESLFVLGVDVSQQGNDLGLLMPMLEQIESRYQSRPKRSLVDSGYLTKDDIVTLSTHKKPSIIYSPIPPKKEGIKPESLRKREKKEAKHPKAVKAFYKRMSKKISQQYYKVRSRIETVNGIIHNRMPSGFQVRGKNKVKSELLLHVIAHNIMTAYRLKSLA